MAQKRQLRPNQIRAWRNHRQLTLEALGAQVGKSHASLSRIERGLQSYNEILLERIADVLGCHPADLLIRNPKDPEGIWGLWDQARPDERRKIVDLARVVLGDKLNPA